MIAKLLGVALIFVSLDGFARAAIEKNDSKPRMPASKSCTFQNDRGWELWIDNTKFFGLDDSATADDKAKIAKMANDLAQAGVCKF